jgi:HSP20 family molecular chaperone IbpA
MYMALTPFRGFWDVQSEVDRLFNDMVGDLMGRRRAGLAQERLWVPRLEAFAREGDVVIHADLPGVALEDVDITLERATAGRPSSERSYRAVEEIRAGRVAPKPRRRGRDPGRIA